MPESAYERLRAMSDAELRALYDRQAATTSVGLQWYIDELRHRELAGQTRTMVRLTWIVAGLTLVNVALVAFTLLR